MGRGISRRWNPWRALRRRPDITLVFEDPGPGLLGRVDYPHATITLHPGLLQAERRSTLTHELVHLERGPAVVGYVDVEERAVEVEAARRLIDLAQLVDAVRWTDDVHELAFELWVDPDTVRIRLRSLPEHERVVLMQAAAARDGAHHDPEGVAQ